MRAYQPLVLLAALCGPSWHSQSAATLRGATDGVSASPAMAARSINVFGIDLLRRLGPGLAKLAISPYSIQNALAPTYAGADGETRAEMARVLRYPDSAVDLHRSFGALAGATQKVGGVGRAAPVANKEAPTDSVVLTVADRLYRDRSVVFRKEYVRLVSNSYRAAVVPLDFRRHADLARLEINDWVAQTTRHRIPEVVPDGALTSSTRLVLVDAIYLKAPWATPFRRNATKPQRFRVEGEPAIEVMTMEVATSLGVERRQGFTVVAIPYVDPDLQFVILLPDPERTLATLEAGLTAELLEGIARAAVMDIRLFLPRFVVDANPLNLGSLLRELGMKRPFGNQADFSRMLPPTAHKHGETIAISDVFHRTFVSVDEDGTEAAAATAVAIQVLISDTEEPPPPPPEIHVDRPFVFAIQHRPSGACLFLGRVMDPR